MANKFLVIDNDYARSSGSSKFIYEELDKLISYDLIWDEKWSKSKSYDKKIFDNYDNILFIHSFLPLDQIYRLRKKNIIWIPMYDSLYNLNQLNNIFWKLIKLLDIKIVSFCDAVANKCKKNSINYLNAKYYLNTSNKINYNFKKFNILFWDRGELKIRDWLHYFEKDEVEKITIIERPDPRKKASFVSNQEIKDFKIDIKKIGFVEKSLYENYLFNHNVFIAPRFREGVGLSFLEALAHGMYIIGYDAPTMNEYLTDEKLGRCIKNRNDSNKKVYIKDIINSQEYRLKLNTHNYKNYRATISALKEFLLKTDNKTLNKNKDLFYILIYQNFYNFFFLIKRILIKIKII
jgi:glycosyltransferase involved in cell wall biosynthesis